MKEFLKDYGTLIGPTFAFGLGVLAIYIKFWSDRQLESWKSKKKMKKLIELILDSKPPKKYYPLKSKDGLLHADQARNLTNLSIFYKRIEIVKSFIDSIEKDILTNCSVSKIQQFQDLKFITSYLFRDIEKHRNDNKHDFSHSDFYNINDSYNRLIIVCSKPEKIFNYIE